MAYLQIQSLAAKYLISLMIDNIIYKILNLRKDPLKCYSVTENDEIPTCL